jgi:hypothetical protein
MQLAWPEESFKNFNFWEMFAPDGIMANDII